jgi:hypothetical protein
MVERICPSCQHGNPVENRFCGACGVALDRNELVRREPAALVIAGQQIPVAQIREVGKAVAVGLAALAAEAGISYLRRRAERVGLPAASLATRPTTALAPQAAEQASKVVTIVSQRVVEVWEQGTLARQVVEKHVWKKEG